MGSYFHRCQFIISNKDVFFQYVDGGTYSPDAGNRPIMEK
jgi:hypothetical protein